MRTSHWFKLAQRGVIFGGSLSLLTGCPEAYEKWLQQHPDHADGGTPPWTEAGSSAGGSGGAAGGSTPQPPDEDAGIDEGAGSGGAGGDIGEDAGPPGEAGSGGSGGAGGAGVGGAGVGGAGVGGTGGPTTGGTGGPVAGTGATGGTGGGTPGAARFDKRVVTDGLSAPYEIAWGPDGFLWLSERTGKRVSRVDPTTGDKKTILELDEVYSVAGQDGLLGFALHPGLLRGAGTDYVYIAFNYDEDPSGGEARRTKLRRYTYDADADALVEPVDLITGLPGSGDHNSGRLVYGPDARLYYSIGDQGHNQFGLKCDVNRAQDLPSASEVEQEDWSTYQGKILRLELDGSIPSDNPVLDGVVSHVYSYGHRNPQGLVFGPNGRLYDAEHGPKTDDELNRIRAGRNYGWPFVAGFQDDKAYVYGNWSAAPDCEDLEFSDYTLPASVPTQAESEFTGEVTEPLLTFYTVDNGFDFKDPACANTVPYICWPTIAPSSLEYYPARDGGVPGWQRSLLITSLKEGSVFRAELNEAGDAVVGEVEPLFETVNRYRDLAISPDGRHFYIITDDGGPTSGPNNGSTNTLENYGAILEYSLVTE